MSKTSPNETPAMKQYRQFKEQYPDYILLFRMGDFYELFYEDAKIVSRELGLALTSRNKGPDAIPLAGLPYHALDGYLARLIRAGHRVAICEQVEDAAQAKGVVRREVVRLVTPGTLTDETLLEQREGNYLAAIFHAGKDGDAGLAWVELSSGLFQCMAAPADHVLDELVRIAPAEILIADHGPLDASEFRQAVSQCTHATVVARPPWVFDARSCLEILHDHFGVKTLEGFGLGDEWNESLSAAGAVIEYLRETQKTALSHIRTLRPFDRTDYMVIDGNTLRCLEVHRTLRSNKRSGSLLACIDRTSTGMGARLLERWLTFPLTGYSAIQARHDAIGELLEHRPALEQVRSLLADMAQIDRIAANIALARVRPRELVALGQSLELLPQLATAVGELNSDLTASLAPALTGLGEPAAWIGATIDPECPNVLRDGGVIAGGYDAELDRLRNIGTAGKDWLAQYQAEQSAATGIDRLKVGFNKVFGYYIEISHANIDKVPDSYVRKQTLKNAERYITDELKQYESEVLTAGERAKQLEQTLFEQLRVQLAEYLQPLQAAAEAVATLDVLAGLAQVAMERRWHRPTMTQENVLNIVGGKHPVLEQQLREQFVANDVTMGARNDRLLIITGPNMAGKSTYIRQVALLTLLAQAGSFIPAESATIGLADRIFTRVGAADELARGLSTFMLEMVETANILNNATPRSLVILDEVGRGTSTCDGLALAWAICEHVALQLKCRTLFATHYHELTELETLLDGTTNLNVAVREWNDEVIFMHKIVPGGTDQSYGVHVARLAGVPKDVIDRARTILPQLQAHLAQGLDMPELARRAKVAAEQMQLFADPATRLVQEIKSIDLNNTTPIQALELLRKLQNDL
jgi:DNA mismatch repair protein MutS